MTKRRANLRKPTFTIKNAGIVGRDIYNDIVKGITRLEPTAGRIQIEVNLEIQDKNLFKDDEIRNSKLLIEVELGKKK